MSRWAGGHVGRHGGAFVAPDWAEAFTDLTFKGIDGKWSATAVVWNTDIHQPDTLELHLVYVGDDDAMRRERNRRVGLESTPEDSKEALKALFDLEDSIPEGKTGIVEVLDEPENGSRFRVRVVDAEELDGE